MPYFIDHKNKFNLEPNPGIGLRECQLGAIWALKSYKTNGTNEIASLISMPTGSGKTAIMMAACFELNLNKILIITPSKILRRQISNQFKVLEILKKTSCLEDNAPSVPVYEVTNRKSTRQEWVDILESNDVIVAHPNSISPYFEALAPIPAELIDAVFIDEAHHEPAPTWLALSKFYKNQLKVFFTATPFRRDRKRMVAKLIYHYSLSQALEKNILRPIEFRGENVGNHRHDSDESLIETAINVFREERTLNHSSSILIRTDRIESAKRLMQLYNNKGLKVDVIHSDRSPSTNERLIQLVKNRDLDGLVCVGIASEGLDIPNLKIAVLHSTPRSIPYTIQFLGRICRTPTDQEGPAKLIANTDAVRGEVRRLYKSDSSWSQLIPQIIDEQMQLARHYSSTKAKEEDFLMPELSVYFSALVYTTPDNFRLLDQISSNSDKFKIVHYEQESEDAPIVVITAYNKPIEWASREIYVEDLLDVHIIYHAHEHNLLFELTTSEKALDSFKDSLINMKLSRLTHGKLFKTLSKFSQSDYVMVGMKNSTSSGSSHPDYKTFMGSSVQASIRLSEGRVFATGHAVLRLDEDNTWGIATRKGRVWAMRRGTATEFKDWCDTLCTLINDGPMIANLPGLSFLAKSEPATSINEIPMAIIPDAIFFKAHTVTISSPNNKPIRNFTPIITPQSLEDNKRLTGVIRIDDLRLNFLFDLDNENPWTIENSEDITVFAERREDTLIEKNIEDVLNEYPPSLSLPDGSIIVGKNKVTPNTSIEKLPRYIWKKKNWAGCNIRHEAYIESPSNQLPVINHTIELLRPSLSQEDIIFLDDGAHEIADLIYFNQKKSSINFIHCKFSGSNSPGCRKSDCDELFAQAMRSIHWVSSPILLERIHQRLANAKNSRIVYGTKRGLDELYDNYRVSLWDFNIILAQPGFSISQVSDRNRSNNNIYELTIPMYERITGSNATIEIWGS
ncbi:DEAD/DEAH box helicase [Endozoicomonas elysicola]|uniref:Helicase n=1 Tax=Endozoicomonas elysicola TaxID=305900 RepID=A0A081KCX3_9GAMM|nr:DEAD/DEAH box helicase family protein [Endozoicomonas elysicola]KEI71999.1 hypothetical protein GV64_15820 [Endozoicomonas elysicola]